MLIPTSDVNLLAACAKSESAVFARDALLSIVAHDLRGSLNTIHTWAHVLEAKFGAVHSGLQNILDGINSGVNQQTKVIENLIEAVYAETKAMPLTYELVLLQPYLESVLAHHRTNFAAERSVVLDADLQIANVEGNVDTKRIWQTLWIMTAYAIEASRCEARINVKALVEQNTCIVSTSFNFSANTWLDEKLVHVFEHFVRAAAVQVSKHGAKLALNLPIAVMAAHGGQFDQQREDDDTVTLILKLPLAAV